jgi:large subunit ribosomal protein L13
VINSAKVNLTGNKEKDKKYFRHSGYPGGIKETNFLDLQKRNPGKAIFLAVKGMMPKGPLGYSMIKKLKIYSDNKHPHRAQNPKPIKLI